MTEHPILFSGPMVRAILDGKKTQTRRVIKWPWKDQPIAEELDNLGDYESLWVRNTKITCPYGMGGDRLWVRETHGMLADDSGARYIYRADPESESLAKAQDYKWRP